MDPMSPSLTRETLPRSSETTTAQADEGSLIKEVLARAESKDSRYFEFELS